MGSGADKRCQGAKQQVKKQAHCSRASSTKRRSLSMFSSEMSMGLLATVAVLWVRSLDCGIYPDGLVRKAERPLSRAGPQKNISRWLEIKPKSYPLVHPAGLVDVIQQMPFFFFFNYFNLASKFKLQSKLLWNCSWYPDNYILSVSFLFSHINNFCLPVTWSFSWSFIIYNL